MAIPAFPSNRAFFNLGLLLLIAVSFPRLERNAENVENRPFQILPGSQLFLKGNSNVTPFTCHCLQAFQPQQFSMTLRQQSNTAVFQNTRLQIETKKLDCGNRGMNRDMHQTLKADAHPYISIRLQEVRFRPAPNGGLGTLTAKAALTVTGQTRTVQMQVKTQQSADNNYRFISAVSMKMTDFGITPPTALLGLVKVDDQIDIHFDLLVQVDPSPAS
jgi:polyisoprenoid-binding protein YceI